MCDKEPDHLLAAALEKYKLALSKCMKNGREITKNRSANN